MSAKFYTVAVYWRGQFLGWRTTTDPEPVDLQHEDKDDALEEAWSVGMRRWVGEKPVLMQLAEDGK